MRIVLFVAFTCLSTVTLSQGHRRMFPNDVLVKVSPLNLLHPTMSSIDGGVSWFITDHYAVQLKAGKKVGLVNLHEGFRYDGFKLLAEGQYFTRHPFYLAFEVGFHKNQFADTMNYFPGADDAAPVRDDYSVGVERLTFVPKVGAMLSISKRICMDFYVGPGIQLQRREVQNLEFDEDLGHRDVNDYYEWVLPPFAVSDGAGGWLSLGFNINWKLVSAQPF